MRVIACALVIFNHLPGYMLYSMTGGGKQFFYMCLTMITRINVPLFFMISGALLFRKDEDLITVFRKRILRIAGILILFELAIVAIQMYLSVTAGTGFEISVCSFLWGGLRNSLPGTEAYWYLYSYLGMLCVLPFLQRIAKGITKTEVISLVALHFITSSLIPMINICLAQRGMNTSIAINSNFSVPFAFEKAFFYTIIGYYLEYHVDMNRMHMATFHGR